MRRYWPALFATLLVAFVFWLPIALLDDLEPTSGDADPAVGVSDGPPPPWVLGFDDAYIYVRFAQQLARGRPFEWSDGIGSTGATSVIYPVLLLPAQWLRSDIPGWSWWSRAVGLFCVGWAACAAGNLLRQIGLPSPWPGVGMFCVGVYGPQALASLSGMESALASAALLTACAALIERPARFRWTGAAWVAVLPFIRPEYLVLSCTTAVAFAIGVVPGCRRRYAGLAVAGPLGLIALDLLVTGRPLPVGATAKSWLGLPFADLEMLSTLPLAAAGRLLGPIYLGSEPRILASGVGLGAAAATLMAALSTRREPGFACGWPRRALPLAVAWVALVAVAPLSTHLFWQEYRHHQPALVAAWVLALISLAALVEVLVERRNEPRWRRAGIVVALGAALLLPRWGFWHLSAMGQLHRRHATEAAWLATNARSEVLLVNDAGWPALAHDGAAVDWVGLGTPALVEAWVSGPGSQVEHLARHPVQPSIAALNPQMVSIEGLLEPPLVVGPRPSDTVVARVRTALLAEAVLPRPGIDLGFLPHERAADLRLTVLPPPFRASEALDLPLSGVEHLEGCRPVFGDLMVQLPPTVQRVTVRAAALPTAATALASGTQRWGLSSEAWSEWGIEVPERGRLVLHRAGQGVPCVESLSWSP